jgi:hypothetical protein
VQNINEISKVMALVKLPLPIRYRPDSQKNSPLISNPNLVILLETMFKLLNKKTKLNQLFEVICNQLGILTEDNISFDETIGEEDDLTYADIYSVPSMSIENGVLSKETAEAIFERLSDRQREILFYRFTSSNPSIIEIGNHLGFSKTTVSNELIVIERLIRESQLDPLEIDDILMYLKELLVTNEITHRST